MTPVTHDEVVRLLGALDDKLVADIVASGAGQAEIETVAAHLADDTDVMGDLERPLTGRARMIYEMVRRAEPGPDE